MFNTDIIRTIFAVLGGAYALLSIIGSISPTSRAGQLCRQLALDLGAFLPALFPTPSKLTPDATRASERTTSPPGEPAE